LYLSGFLMRNKIAFRVALGGVISSLAVFMMFCSGIFPMLDYTIPTFTGFLMVIMIVETSASWAFLTYISVSFLSLMITPNLQVSLLFVMFMGYYPILKYYLDKLKKRPLAILIKFAVFNAAMISYYLLFQFVFLSEDMLEGLERFGKWAPLVLLGIANAFFILYDKLVGDLTVMYVNWFRHKILRRK